VNALRAQVLNIGRRIIPDLKAANEVRSLLFDTKMPAAMKSHAKAWFPVLAGFIIGMIVGSWHSQLTGMQVELAQHIANFPFPPAANMPKLESALGETHSEETVCLEFGDATPSSRVRPSSADMSNCLLDTKLDNYFQLLSDVLVGLPFAGRCNLSNGCQPPQAPYDENLRRFGNDWPPDGYTMIGKERLANFRAAILEVNRNRIPGAIAEFGVWRGRAMMMAAATQKYDPFSVLPRDLYLCDAYGSFGKYGNANDFLAVPLEKVQGAFETFGLNNDNIYYVKGLFSDTVKEWVDRKDPIAVLRVDGNFYSSYQDVLYAVYENVPVGGIVIFDDVMSHEQVMQCWKDFKEDQNIPEELVRIDQHSAWFRKTKDVPEELVRIDQHSAWFRKTKDVKIDQSQKHQVN